MQKMTRLLLCLMTLGWMAETARSENPDPPAYHEAEYVILKDQAAINLLQQAMNAQTRYHRAIQTWRGTVDMQETMRTSPELANKIRAADPGQAQQADQKQSSLPNAAEPVFMKRSNRFVFKLSKPLEASASLYESTSPITGKSGKREWVWKENVYKKYRTLYRDQSLYTKEELTGDDLGGVFFEPEPGERASVESIYRTRSNWSQISSHGNARFDPRAIFWSGGNRIDLKLNNYINLLNDPRYAKLVQVMQSTDGRYLSVLKRSRLGENGFDDLRLICDSRQQYLPVCLNHTLNGQTVLSEDTWTYRQAGRLPRPEEYVLTIRNLQGQLTVRRIFSFTSSQFNAPLSRQDFDLVSLQPQDGDRLIDRVKNQKFVFQNGKPEPAAEF